VLEQLYTIVNTRYEDGSAILLDHEPVDADGRPRAARQIGDRTVSRLYEMCGDPLPMFGADQRARPVRLPSRPAGPPRTRRRRRWDGGRDGRRRRAPVD
jgi:DNA replication protein DnaC